MRLCPTCGAPLEEQASPCRYDVPEDEAPSLGDYEAMSRGQLTHEEHQVHVARWVVHNEGSQSERTIQLMRSVALRNRGRVVAFFKLARE